MGGGGEGEGLILLIIIFSPLAIRFSLIMYLSEEVESTARQTTRSPITQLYCNPL